MLERLLRLFKLDNFLPIEDVASIHEMDKNEIASLRHNSTYGNDKRFKIVDGKLLVHINFKAMLQEDLQNLYYKALIISKNPSNLSKQLSITTGIKKTTLEKYFVRFNFKQIKKASFIMEHMKNYINNNSLFAIDDLVYDEDLGYAI